MITLYHAVASRAFVALWMLEELGVPFHLRPIDLRRRQQKHPDFLRLNPMGKVPVLRDGDVVVSETPAICLYLADRYASGTLAPALDAAERGPFLRWMIMSTSVFEPAIYLPPAADDDAASGAGWGHTATVLDMLDTVLQRQPYLLGETFSAADVTLGGLFSIALFNKRFETRPAFVAYDARLRERPAYQRAGATTWPASA